MVQGATETTATIGTAARTAGQPALQSTAAEQEVNDLLQGAWKARAVHVAVELGIPDLVSGGAVGWRELARSTGAHPQSLRKLLRLLATVGVLEPVIGSGGELAVGPTPMSEVLRADDTAVVATDARFQAAPWHWAAWGQLEHSIRTGGEAFAVANGASLWEVLQNDSRARARFDAAMSSVSLRESLEVPARYDFTGDRHIVDVGGGTGSLLAAVLESSPASHGTLLDRPENVEVARRRFAERGLLDRVEVVGGDFHETVPAGADVYVIKHVLHNWADDDVVGILNRIRVTMRPDSRILILDNLIEPESSADTLFVDLLMLVLAGGGDREEREFAGLAERAGLRVRRTGPAGTGALRYLECVPASDVAT
jgi:hypothetical protein